MDRSKFRRRCRRHTQQQQLHQRQRRRNRQQQQQLHCHRQQQQQQRQQQQQQQQQDHHVSVTEQGHCDDSIESFRERKWDKIEEIQYGELLNFHILRFYVYLFIKRILPIQIIRLSTIVTVLRIKNN